jgi:hypothetical protein
MLACVFPVMKAASSAAVGMLDSEICSLEQSKLSLSYD